MNVLIIGDTHCPVMLPEYPAFLKRVQKKYDCKKIVHIGDLVDWSSISYHPKAPSLKNADEEFDNAFLQVQKLYRAFPRVTWLIGNHDSLTERQCEDIGLPLTVLKDYVDLWDIPGWKTIPRYGQLEIDGVVYQHGDRGLGGQLAALKNAKAEFCSVVQGHLHQQAGVWWTANHKARVFGMQVGCGVDGKALAMSYGRKFNSKPIIGCGVVINGRTAIFEPMHLK